MPDENLDEKGLSRREAELRARSEWPETVSLELRPCPCNYCEGRRTWHRIVKFDVPGVVAIVNAGDTICLHCGTSALAP